MKRLLLAALVAVLPTLGFAAGNDVLMNQRNAADTATLSRTLAHPPGGQNGILGFNGATVLPQFFIMGSGLNLSGGTLSAPAPDWSAIPGKPTFATVATTGAYTDLSGVPSTFAPAPHTHSAADVVSGVLADARIPALAISKTTGLQAALDGKLAVPAGTVGQYLRGDGSLATFPTAVSAFSNDSAYLNQAGARAAISLTTTGTSGAATYNSGTGVLNIPNYAPGTGTVTSITAGTGLSGGTITTSGTISMPNVGTAGTYNASVTTDAQGRVTAGASISINDSPGRSLVTSTSATGYQVSATRVAQVCYEGSFSTTSTIGGPATATVFLETADTNSTTPGDWTTKATQTYSNTITLAVVLNQVQGNNWSFCRYIPAGKYVRIRSGSISGTASVSLNANQQEVLH